MHYSLLKSTLEYRTPSYHHMPTTTYRMTTSTIQPPQSYHRYSNNQQKYPTLNDRSSQKQAYSKNIGYYSPISNYQHQINNSISKRQLLSIKKNNLTNKNKMTLSVYHRSNNPQEYYFGKDRYQRNKNNKIQRCTNNTTTSIDHQEPHLSHFFIFKKIGQGKYGQLYSALHKPTGTLYALKKMKKQSIVKEKLIERVILEIKIQSYLQHPNIVKLYGTFHDADNIYIIMELMEEGSLFSKITKMNYHQSNASILPTPTIIPCLRELLSALNALHQLKIIHRDIKPENVVLSFGVSKICDFGWSVIIKDERRNTSCGTFDYAPPEILKGQQYDESIDLWQLGVLAYELVTGKLPFYHVSRRQTYLNIVNYNNQLSFPSEVGEVVRDFICKLLNRNCSLRMPASLMLQHQLVKV